MSIFRNLIMETQKQDDGYIQNGLVAWYESEDGADASGHLPSRIGNDYIYNYTNPSSSIVINDGYLYNDMTKAYASSTDYYVQGYTIEVVGYLTGDNNTGSTGSWLITGSISQTAGIGTESSAPGKIIFQNSESVRNLSTETYTKNVPFSASLYLENVFRRDGAYTTQESVNGKNYITHTATETGHSRTNNNKTVFLSYYVSNYYASGGIKSIRVYNRQLTENEMKHNYQIDKTRFNLVD